MCLEYYSGDLSSGLWFLLVLFNDSSLYEIKFHQIIVSLVKTLSRLSRHVWWWGVSHTWMNISIYTKGPGTHSTHKTACVHMTSTNEGLFRRKEFFIVWRVITKSWGDAQWMQFHLLQSFAFSSASVEWKDTHIYYQGVPPSHPREYSWSSNLWSQEKKGRRRGRWRLLRERDHLCLLYYIYRAYLGNVM